MIDAQRLLKDLKRLLKTLDDDIRERLGESPELRETLSLEWQATREARRTARTEADWLDEEITQAAVHWILGCVFLRFIEDNGLVERPWLAGPGSGWHSPSIVTRPGSAPTRTRPTATT